MLWRQVFSDHYKDVRSDIFFQEKYFVTIIQTVSVFSLALFSLWDLRSRLIPLIDAFFVLVAGWALLEAPLHGAILTAVVLWGIVPGISSRLALLFVFYPAVWPVLLAGFGVRKQMVGRADLLALAIISFAFPFPAVIVSIFGFELWRRWWIRRGKCGLVPALPGLFLGLAVYSLAQIAISHILPIV